MRLLRIAPKSCPPAQVRRSTSAWLGFAGGLLARWFGGRMPRVRTEDLRRCDYRASTQRIGVHFSERIRDAFRSRWIKKIS